MNTAYRPGPRSYRTTAAVSLCLLLCWLLGRPSSFFAAIAAVICTQSNGERTVNSGLHRFFGTIIGGVVGFFYLELTRHIPIYPDLLHIFLIPPAVFGAIYLCNLLERRESVSICCVVLLNVATNYERDIPNTLLYVSNRVLDTGIGIVAAVVVSRLWAELEKRLHKEEI